MIAGLVHHLDGRLGEADHARRADRIGRQHPAGRVERDASADGGLAGFGELPALALGGEAQALQPHRFVPGERHVDLADVDLVDGAGDAGGLPQRSGGVAAGLRVDLVAPRVRERFGAQRGRVDPCHRVTLGDARVGGGFVTDHQGGRAVRGRAGLVVSDRIPQHR